GFFFFFQAEDGIRDRTVTGVQTCALPISGNCLELAAWPFCSRAPAHLRRPPNRPELPRALRNANHLVRPRDPRRSLRRRRSLYAARLHCSSLDRRRSLAGLARDHRLTEAPFYRTNMRSPIRDVSRSEERRVGKECRFRWAR